MKYNTTKTGEQWYYMLLRTQAHLTASDVAKILGVSRKTIWRFEKGEYKLESKSIKKVRQFYLELHKKQLERKGE